jgi:hypothetical protein
MSNPAYNEQGPDRYVWRPGLGHVPSYQIAGRPYCTGSATIDSGVQHKIEFPTVARSVTVINRTSEDLRVHFNDASANENVTLGQHYITLGDAKDSITMNVKCKEIYITSQGNGGAYELFAELTDIPTKEMFELSGSGLTDMEGPIDS